MLEKIYFGLHVNCQLLLTHSDQNCNVSKTNMKLNENPFSGSHVVASEQTW
jgi:hypothetical protein